MYHGLETRISFYFNGIYIVVFLEKLTSALKHENHRKIMRAHKRRRTSQHSPSSHIPTTNESLVHESSTQDTQTEATSTQQSSSQQISSPILQPSSTNRSRMINILSCGKKYIIPMTVSIYDYSSKKKATKKLPDLTLQVDTVKEAKEFIWREYNKYIKGHTKNIEEIAEDGARITKTVIDNTKEMNLENKFFRFHDSIGKKNIMLGEVIASKLDTWMRRENSSINLRIYPFGVEIDGEAFKDLESLQLSEEIDRSGATKEEILTSAVKKLKEIHGDVWNAYDISWRMWANDIVANTQQSDIERTIESSVGPPNYFVHLFRLRQDHSIIDVLNNRSQANEMALKALRDVKLKLKEQLRTIELYESFLLEDSAFLEETASSHTYANSVREQPDVDH